MDFNMVGSIILISLILITFSIIYVLYTIYNEVVDFKYKFDKIDQDILDNSNKIKEAEKKTDTLMSESENCEEEEDEEDYEEEDYEDEEDSEVHDTEEYDISSKEMDMFDQLLINSKNLNHLQKIQQEINGNIDDTATYAESYTDTASENCRIENEGLPKEPEESVEDGEISFEDESKPVKCTQELKAGKNKGTLCQKDAIHGGLLCKVHDK